jgi:hypothetical protein
VGPQRIEEATMSQFNMNQPRTPGGRMGDDMEKQLMNEAEHERLAHETEEIHREEAAEEGKILPKKPWWKFWA